MRCVRAVLTKINLLDRDYYSFMLHLFEADAQASSHKVARLEIHFCSMACGRSMAVLLLSAAHVLNTWAHQQHGRVASSPDSRVTLYQKLNSDPGRLAPHISYLHIAKLHCIVLACWLYSGHPVGLCLVWGSKSAHSTSTAQHFFGWGQLRRACIHGACMAAGRCGARGLHPPRLRARPATCPPRPPTAWRTASPRAAPARQQTLCRCHLQAASRPTWLPLLTALLPALAAASWTSQCSSCSGWAFPIQYCCALPGAGTGLSLGWAGPGCCHWVHHRPCNLLGLQAIARKQARWQAGNMQRPHRDEASRHAAAAEA